MKSSSEHRQLRVLQTTSEIEKLREAWESFNPARDADLDFFLFITDQMQALRPHVIAIYEQNKPIAILIARIEEQRLPVKFGYFDIQAPKMRMMQFIHNGLLGAVSEEIAHEFVTSIVKSLALGEAEVALFHSIPVDSPLSKFARNLPGRLCSDFIISPQIHRARRLPIEAGGFLAGLSQNERYQQRKRARKLQDQFPENAIQTFCNPEDVPQLVDAAESIARKSYQRRLGVGFSNTPMVRARLEFEARKGWLRGFILDLGGRPCAFWIGSIYRGCFVSDYLAFDPDYGQFSPGMYLTLSVLADFCNDKSGPVSNVDFGGGDAPYKERLGNVRWEEIAVCMFAPTVKGVSVNLFRTGMGLVNLLARRVLQGTGLWQRLKRWSRIKSGKRTA